MRVKQTGKEQSKAEHKEDKNKIRTDRQQDIKICKLTYF